ncbi:unnamed protein product [Pseudo-nitzschia multistriata]|uniref:Plastid lipid-associated protein/fibrillin conserved domain-containing protein n=1 Tax=Pseudo-nitzschia multistriata TaxID=183589 RepID=A0A448ZGD6_9STRA|nr:unnamed protein product [Pseudo-nitzschia multistriata]
MTVFRDFSSSISKISSATLRHRFSCRQPMMNLGLVFLAVAMILTTGALCLSSPSTSKRVHDTTTMETNAALSRRSCLATAAAGLITGAAAGDSGIFGSVVNVKPAFATETSADAVETKESSLQSTLLDTNRNNLLQSIRNNNSEAEILAAIDTLVPLDPSENKGATMASDLDGEWELLWSAKAEAFSPLLKLPKPFKPDSFQYLGSAAAQEVGPGRVAQGLTGGILGANTQLWLSSGVRPSSDDASVLEILPPFRFEVGGRYGSGTPKNRLVEAGSDAEFRKLNARTTEAQEAPKNSYKQLYLEREGKGSLRISTITAGDPVIVGAIFVHRKL